MPEKKRMWVRSKRDDEQVVFYEVSDEHPGGSAMVAGKAPVEVAETAKVAEALRQGPGKGIEECSEADRAAWHQEREEARNRALGEGTPLGFAPVSSVEAMRAEIAELRAQIGRRETTASSKAKE